MAHPSLSPKDRRLADQLIERLALLKSLGEFSDSEISRETEVGQTSVSAWFRERNVPLGHSLARLPHALSRPQRRVNGHWLLTGEGEMYLPAEGETSPESFLRGGYAMLAEIEEALGKARRRLLDHETRLSRERGRGDLEEVARKLGGAKKKGARRRA